MGCRNWNLPLDTLSSHAALTRRQRPALKLQKRFEGVDSVRESPRGGPCDSSLWLRSTAQHVVVQPGLSSRCAQGRSGDVC